MVGLSGCSAFRGVYYVSLSPCTPSGCRSGQRHFPTRCLNLSLSLSIYIYICTYDM